MQTVKDTQLASDNNIIVASKTLNEKIIKLHVFDEGLRIVSYEKRGASFAIAKVEPISVENAKRMFQMDETLKFKERNNYTIY